MSELTIELVKAKTKKGILALVSRTAFLQITVNIATFILTILLEPQVFGIFIVISAVVSFLRYVSDIGLAAALVQKKDPPTQSDLKTTFTIQLGLTLLFIGVAILLSNSVVRWYKLDNSGYWLYHSLLIAFLISSLKTIPSILLERKLEFEKLVIPEIIETILFYLAVVTMAWKGFGVYSFTLGVLLRAVSGLIAIYIISPWKPGLELNINSAKKLLSFGVPFQINSFLALIKDDVLTMYLGGVVGLTNLAYIGWAKKWAEVPLRLIMDNVNKVSFPAFARLQESKDSVKSGIEKAIYFVALFTIPMVGSMIVLVDYVVDTIPRYQKWEPALFSFYLFSITVILSSLSSLSTNIIQSLGKIKIILKLMVLWTTLTWLLIPVFIRYYGYNGVAIASLLISITSVIPIFIIHKLTSFSIQKTLSKPVLIGLTTILVMWFSKFLVNLPTVYELVLVATLGLIFYILLLIKFSLAEIMQIIKFKNK